MVECLLPKQKVASSNLVSRSTRLTQLSASPYKSLVFHLSRYRLDAAARGLSEASIRDTFTSLRYFDAALGGIDDVTMITGDDLRRFIISLKAKKVARWHGRGNRPLSPVSVNTYVRGVRAFWSWLARNGVIAANPLAAVPAPRFPRLVARVYTEDQLKTVLGCVRARPRERAMLNLFLDSGIRLSELAGVKVDDLDLAQGSVRVLGKGGKERYSYFSPVTALSLQDYIRLRPLPQCDDFLFLTLAGIPLGKSGIQAQLQRTGRQAGLGVPLSPHRLRHTYATLSLKNGNNLEYIRITLGHSDIKTTSDAYLAASQADVARAHRRFSPLAHLVRKK